MKIDNSVNPLGGLPPGKRNGSAKPAGGASAGTEVAGTEVGISARLQEISGSMANTPVVDAGRVSEIKQAIAEGRFKVDPGKIADGLINSVREMLSAHP